MQNCGENGAAERMCRRKLAGLSEPKWRFSSPQRGRKTGSVLRTAASAASGGCASYRLSLERQGTPAAFAPWPLWSGCRWLCRSRPALSVTTRWGLRLLRTRATSAGGVLLLTHARAGVDTEVESSALSSWSPAAQGGAVAAERVGVEFRESRFFFSATGSSFSEVRASSST